MDQGARQEAHILQGLIIKPDEDAEDVPFAVWDPDRPAEHLTPFSKLSKPMHVDLHPGDMLYLPSLW
jgi:peptidyl-lysine (3S)-dioxygenase / protease